MRFSVCRLLINVSVCIRRILFATSVLECFYGVCVWFGKATGSHWRCPQCKSIQSATMTSNVWAAYRLAANETSHRNFFFWWYKTVGICKGSKNGINVSFKNDCEVAISLSSCFESVGVSLICGFSMKISPFSEGAHEINTKAATSISTRIAWKIIYFYKVK